jgi:hypothetical protein
LSNAGRDEKTAVMILLECFYELSLSTFVLSESLLHEAWPDLKLWIQSLDGFNGFQPNTELSYVMVVLMYPTTAIASIFPCGREQVCALGVVWFFQVLEDQLCDGAEDFQLLCGQEVCHVASHGLFIVDSRCRGELASRDSDADNRSAVICGAFLSCDESSGFHASELVGESALFSVQSARSL